MENDDRMVCNRFMEAADNCYYRNVPTSTDFLDMDCVTVPVTGAVILEVKWDEFLPSAIRDAVQLEGRHTSSFSKYAACRIYD